MRRRHRRALVAGVVMIVAAAGALIGTEAFEAHRDHARTAQPGRVALSTTTVERGTLADTMTATGSISFAHPRVLRGTGTGIITALPQVGSTTEQGAALYRVDDQPVAVLYGDTPLFRAIDRVGLAGADIAVLAHNLEDLGFFGGFIPDDPHEATFTPLLQTDLKDWQTSIGATATGTLLPGQAVVLPSTARVTAVSAALGDPGAEPVATLTDTDRIVTGTAPPGLPAGPAVLTLPTGSKVPATVTVAGNPDQATFSATPTTQDVIGTLDHGTVDVAVTTQIHRDVLTVPIVALLAVRGGAQYALQRPDGHLIPVRTGMFTSDRVEVSGAGLTEGMSVVTAA